EPRDALLVVGGHGGHLGEGHRVVVGHRPGPAADAAQRAVGVERLQVAADGGRADAQVLGERTDRDHAGGSHQAEDLPVTARRKHVPYRSAGTSGSTATPRRTRHLCAISSTYGCLVRTPPALSRQTSRRTGGAGS